MNSAPVVEKDTLSKAINSSIQLLLKIFAEKNQHDTV